MKNNFKSEVMKKNLIVILGPTASGKTSLGIRLAAEFKGEIISADSRQVFKGMDIGTGKDLSEYKTEQGVIASHLIDILEPENEFNVYEFQRKFYEIFQDIQTRSVLPVLVGGTGLYLESVLTDYAMPYAQPDQELRKDLAARPLAALRDILLQMKPALHNRTDLDNRERLIRRIEIERARKITQCHSDKRPVIDACIFGIQWDRAILRQRISDRLQQRLAEGMIEEVQRLKLRGISWERLESFGLEYRYIAWYLQQKITKQEMTDKLRIAIGQFAKRQMTWFRRMEKKGVPIEWIGGEDYSTLRQKVICKFK
jgi:tRNA dimethylallyltransferase